MEAEIVKLVSELRRLAPGLWAQAVRDQILQAIICPSVNWLLAVALFVVGRKLWRFADSDEAIDEDAWRGGAIVAYIFAGAAAIGALFFSVDAILTLANPELYALKVLLKR